MAESNTARLGDRSLHVNLFNAHIAGCLVGKQSYKFFNQLTEDRRRCCLVAQNGELLSNEWVVGYVQVHEPNLPLLGSRPQHQAQG